ncbi:MAG: type 2 lanthipeptide synthetase LanM, partial [Pseudomonadota bacterium]
PSLKQVHRRIQGLEPEGLQYQTALVRGSLYANTMSAASKPGITTRTQGLLHEELAATVPLSPAELVEEAQRLAAEIRDQAIRGRDGSAMWVGLAYDFQKERFAFRPMDNSLYSGGCGIALFLAAFEHVTGDTSFHELALGTLQPIQRQIKQTDPALIQRLARPGVGGAVGLGSMLYACVRIARFLQEPELIDTAIRLSQWITPEVIQADRHLDLIGGAAGGLLSLLALHDETRDPQILAKAVACGQHLLDHRESDDGTPKAWKTLGEKPLTGLSHGAAGISYALLKLHAITQDPDYLVAAEEGMAYERGVFSPEVGNWPDFRDATATVPRFGESWCHGAPGIGLARLGGLAILDNEAIRQDIESALRTTTGVRDMEIDHLCCGTFGRIETMLVAADRLGRPSWLDVEHQRAAWAVRRAQRTGAYQLFPSLPMGVFNPIFHQGTAGIGYQLLRLAAPEKLPSVLLWE